MAKKMEDKVAVYISMVNYSISELKDAQRGSEVIEHSRFPSSLESLSFRLLVNKDNKQFFPNVTCSDFKEIVQKTKDECKNASMLLVVISSHGRELQRNTGGPILEYDHQIALHNEYVNTTEIIKEFALCISPEKPKIFIVEACSTKFKDKDQATQNKDKVRDFGITLTLTKDEPQQDFSAYQPPPETGHDESRGVVIPVCVQNSLVVFSSPSGYQSYTSPGPDGGAWLLLEFRNQLDKETEEEDFSLLDFLARVNQRMSYRETNNDYKGCKAVATIRHKLTEDITLRKQKQRKN